MTRAAAAGWSVRRLQEHLKASPPAVPAASTVRRGTYRIVTVTDASGEKVPAFDLGFGIRRSLAMPGKTGKRTRRLLRELVPGDAVEVTTDDKGRPALRRVWGHVESRLFVYAAPVCNPWPRLCRCSSNSASMFSTSAVCVCVPRRTSCPAPPWWHRWSPRPCPFWRAACGCRGSRDTASTCTVCRILRTRWRQRQTISTTFGHQRTPVHEGGPPPHDGNDPPLTAGADRCARRSVLFQITGCRTSPSPRYGSLPTLRISAPSRSLSRWHRRCRRRRGGASAAGQRGRFSAL